LCEACGFNFENHLSISRKGRSCGSYSAEWNTEALEHWVHILRAPYLSAGEFNPVLNRFVYLTEEAVPTVSFSKLRYPPLDWALISFQINWIELPAKR